MGKPESEDDHESPAIQAELARARRRVNSLEQELEQVRQFRDEMEERIELLREGMNGWKESTDYWKAKYDEVKSE